jgi:hypothetical protein
MSCVLRPSSLTTRCTSQPTDSGDGLCALGRKPVCCSGASSSSICAKCRQGRHLPCPLITRYRLELDDSPSFQDLDFVREYDVPGVSRRLSQTQGELEMQQGPALKVRSPGEAVLLEGGPEESDFMGGGLGDMRNRTLYSLDAPNLPLGGFLGCCRVLVSGFGSWVGELPPDLVPLPQSFPSSLPPHPSLSVSLRGLV